MCIWSCIRQHDKPKKKNWKNDVHIMLIFYGCFNIKYQIKIFVIIGLPIVMISKINVKREIIS